MTTNPCIEKALIGYGKKGSSFIEVIVKVSARESGIRPSELVAKSRKREIVQARQIAMTLSKYMTSTSLNDIGYEIGRKDHATVLHAVKTIHNLIDTDRGVRTIVMRVINILTSYEISGLVCQICGGSRIQQKGWVNPNSMKTIELIEDQDLTNQYCVDCECHVKFVTTQTFNNYDEEHQLEAVPSRV